MPSPQHRKLGLGPGVRLAVLDAPPGWALEDAPDGLEPPDDGTGAADVVLLFVRADADLAALDRFVERVRPAGAVWVLWPRRAAGHVSDVTEDGIRRHALPLGVVDVKVAAVDHDWSGLKLVWRRENR